MKFCWNFGIQFEESVQTNWQEGYYHDNARPHSASAAEERIQNYSGNFLNIRLTAWTWPLVISACLVR
jgi:hypothetical protein